MKNVQFLIVTLGLCFGTMLFPVTAQDVSGTCTKDSVNLAIAAVAKSAQDAQAAADPKSAVDILAVTANKIAALQSDCSGLSFTGKTPTVLGPIDFPTGIYKVIAKSSGHLTAVTSILDGECGQGSGIMLSEAIFIGVESDAQTVFTSNGCSALIEVKDDNWAIQFQKIK